MRHAFSRRRLLCQGAGAGLATLTPWRARSADAEGGNVNVCVWLRGGADGLSLLVPYGDDEYRRARPHTALLPPGSGARSALPLTAELGLHPKLAPLLPDFRAGEATIVTAVGAQAFTGSHATAEQVFLAALERRWAPVRVRNRATSLATQLSSLGRQVLNGAAPPAVLLELEGWDTHAAQGDGEQGLLTSAVAELGRDLSEFRSNLGAARHRVQLVVTSELGRSLHETPLAGTDDGHATIALLLGGPARDAPVIGSPPLLSREALSRGRHWAPRLDFDMLFAGLPPANGPR